MPKNELSDAESLVNQPIPAAPAAHDLMIFFEEMYAQVTEAARRYGVEIDRMFAFYPTPRQQLAQRRVVSFKIWASYALVT